MDRFEFEIPDQNLEKFKAMMKAISRKSEKLGFATIPYFVYGYHFDEKRGKIWEVYLSSPSFKVGGWSFAATIDHTPETGNIVRCVPHVNNIPERFRDAQPVCEHCNIRRYRRDTYVLRSDDGSEFKQVGKSCLTDFLGHDPAKLARLAEYVAQMREDIEGFGMCGGVPMLPLSSFLEISAVAIRKFGWISRKVSRENGTMATADEAVSMYYDKKHNFFREVTDDDRALVAGALAWAQEISEKEEKNDYEHNIGIVSNAQYIEVRTAGIAASIVAVYRMKLARDAEAKNTVSNYVGVIGDKFAATLKVVYTNRLESGSTLCKMQDDNGNIFTWFATNFHGKIGDMIMLSGKVRDHKEYKGVKSTILSNCRVKQPA